MAASIAIPIISGLAGLIGGLTPKTTTQTGSSSTTGTQSGSSQSSTTPQLSDLQQLMSSIFGPGLVNQFSQGTNLQPYAENALQTNNETANAASTNIANTLAAKGLSNSPYAAYEQSQPALQEQQQNSQVLSSLPLLSQQLNLQNLQALVGGFSALPTGTSTEGSGNTSTSSNTSGTQTTTGNGSIGAGLAGGLGGSGAALASEQTPSWLQMLMG